MNTCLRTLFKKLGLNFEINSSVKIVGMVIGWLKNVWLQITIVLSTYGTWFVIKSSGCLKRMINLLMVSIIDRTACQTLLHFN